MTFSDRVRAVLGQRTEELRCYNAEGEWVEEEKLENEVLKSDRLDCIENENMTLNTEEWKIRSYNLQSWFQIDGFDLKVVSFQRYYS